MDSNIIANIMDLLSALVAAPRPAQAVFLACLRAGNRFPNSLHAGPLVAATGLSRPSIRHALAYLRHDPTLSRIICPIRRTAAETVQDYYEARRQYYEQSEDPGNV